jgi:predicted nuclease with TOPRIM domain
MRVMISTKLILLGLFTIALAACSTAYYATWETLGKEKRDLLRDNVVDARDDQAKAQQEFKDALTRLKELTQFSGGDLEKAYDAIKDDYEACSDRADTLRGRIKKVDSIANDMFEEWQTEIGQISNARMKEDSAQKLKLTQQKYSKLHLAMQQAEKKMDPVLTRLHDNVLYLKHNLNAQAVGALGTEVADIEKEVEKLIKEMEISIAKADDFIATLPQ